MEIVSFKYALLIIVSLFVFYLLKPRFRILFLTFLSCGFIVTYSIISLIYILVFTIINYFIGLRIPQSKNKLLLYRTGIVLNLSQLILLRYSSFAIDPIFQLFNSNILVSNISEILVPIGISFYTLQAIGYLVNVRMGWEKPEDKFVNFLLYIIFYPKFLSGPIERSNHFLPQLKETILFNEQQILTGLRIALLGFFKKTAIANQLAPFVIGSYANLESVDGTTLWLLLVIQPLYLYFDFSGYTDIAIGIAKTFGINLLPNFNRPFFSKNVTTFWKRFHISLSSWFNDYVFRQASFKHRKWGHFASTYAVFLTFFFFGVWHGAGWNFMILGLMQALAINYEFYTKRLRLKLFSRIPDSFGMWFGRVITFLFFGTSLVFFFSPDINSTLLYFVKMFDVNQPLLDCVIKEIPLSVIAFILIYLCIELINHDYKNVSAKLSYFWSGGDKKRRFLRWIVYGLILIIIIVLGNKGPQFIYSQF